MRAKEDEMAKIGQKVDRRRVEKALCTLVDYEWKLKDVGHKKGINFDHAFSDVCDVLRTVADGED